MTERRVDLVILGATLVIGIPMIAANVATMRRVGAPLDPTLIGGILATMMVWAIIGGAGMLLGHIGIRLARKVSSGLRPAAPLPPRPARDQDHVRAARPHLPSVRT